MTVPIFGTFGDSATGSYGDWPVFGVGVDGRGLMILRPREENCLFSLDLCVYCEVDLQFASRGPGTPARHK